MAIGRRKFLTLSGLGLSSLALTRGQSGWAFAGDRPAPSRLVVVMLRGAVDGLNVVAPYSESNYAASRPSIALGAPGADGGVLDLDGHFGLHPALQSLMPLWQSKRLAFVHASGSPDPSRSHFDAQYFMESGTPGIETTPDGWMNRLIGALPGESGPTRAISLGPTRPHILDGSQPNTNFGLGKNADKPLPIDRPVVADAFASLYGGGDPMSQAFQEGTVSRKELMGDLQDEQTIADNGAPQPDSFPAVARRLAGLMRQDDRVQLAFADLGGWDTHVKEGNAKGQLATHLKPLGDGLAALADGLGPQFDDTVVIVMSEFGRTVHENGNGGTDHGHGNAMWVMGGKVAGGVVHGRWPGLDEAALYQSRDLAITSDFRNVIGLVLERHLTLTDRQLAVVFPNGPSDDPALAGLISA